MAGLRYLSASPLPASPAGRGQGEGRRASELWSEAAPHPALRATFSPQEKRGEVKPRPALISIIALSLFVTTPARAACPQELSIYEDTNGNSLTFTPPQATQAAEHEFTLRIGTAALQGVVMMTNEPQRPEAIIMDSCPEGDVTGAELDQCTVWQGVVYGLTKEAKAPYLGKRGAPNADAILLPDVSRLVLDHTFKVALAGPAKVDDVFVMKACQE
jgi:hypothetical protein